MKLKDFGFKMHKASWLILIVFFVLMALDYYSTYCSGVFNLVKYIESNPVYIYTGWLPVLLLNFLAIYLILKWYDNSKPDYRFFYITLFVWLSVVRIATVISNFTIAASPPTLEEAQQLATSTKVSAYFVTQMVSMVLPIIVSLIIYLIWRIDHKGVIKNG